MSYTQDKSDKEGGNECCIFISLKSVASHMHASDGRDIPFSKAILTVRNVCDSGDVNIIPHAKLGQEGGTVQDVSGSLLESAELSIPAGGTASWDVYELLISAHSGAGSKVHMFGYRAVLNWRFDLEAWAEYRAANSSIAALTPVSKWALRWTIKDPATGEVELAIEDVKC